MATYGGSSDPNPTKMATFKTSDGMLVKVPVEIAKMFYPFKDSDDDDLEREPWDISDVSSDVLNIVVCACRYLRDRRSENVALQEFDYKVFGQQTDETIVEHVKAANYLEIKALLDFEMPSFRKWFGLGDDKGADFVYTAEFETILLRRAASASEGASTPTASRYVMVM